MGTRMDKVWALHRIVGSRIKGLRGKRGLSAPDVAERLGREQKLIWRLEQGRRKLDDVSLLFALAAALEVPPLVLLLPEDGDALIDLIPGRPPVRARDAYAWIIGARLLPGDVPEADAESEQTYQAARATLHKHLSYINPTTARVAGIDVHSSRIYELVQGIDKDRKEES